MITLPRYTVLVLLVGGRKRKIRLYLCGVRAAYLLIYYSLLSSTWEWEERTHSPRRDGGCRER